MLRTRLLVSLSLCFLWASWASSVEDGWGGNDRDWEASDGMKSHHAGGLEEAWGRNRNEILLSSPSAHPKALYDKENLVSLEAMADRHFVQDSMSPGPEDLCNTNTIQFGKCHVKNQYVVFRKSTNLNFPDLEEL